MKEMTEDNNWVHSREATRSCEWSNFQIADGHGYADDSGHCNLVEFHGASNASHSEKKRAVQCLQRNRLFISRCVELVKSSQQSITVVID